MKIGRVYKVIHHQGDELYIGSTFNQIRHRWQEHKRAFKKYLNGKSKKIVSLYPFMEKYGIENFTIILIKKYHVIDRNQLLAYEQLWINKFSKICVNKLNTYQPIPKKVLNKIYRIKNKDKIRESDNKYYGKNKDKILEKVKQYQKDNKDTISEKKRQKITCVCGRVVSRNNIHAHKKSKIHKELMDEKT